MRGWVAMLSVAGALAAAPIAQAQPPAGRLPAATPARVDLTNPILAYYPAGALAAHVEGQAVIRCKRDEHLALAGCTLVSETPAGQGFGAAALAMAGKSPPNPQFVLKDAADQPAADATVRFQLTPPFITPDLTRMAHMVRNPQIATRPTAAQIQAAYPTRALDNQIEGGATIECVATTGGKLADCHVYNETPTGYGFGQAALDLAVDFALTPRLVDGAAVDGPIRIAIGFSPGDPSAPLTLGTSPAGQDAGDRRQAPKRPDRNWGGPDGTGGFGGPGTGSPGGLGGVHY